MQYSQRELTGFVQQVLSQLHQVIVGKDDALISILAGILAGGHILLEDIPGVGKTTIALAFSRIFDLSYGRVQFTPDILPSDITGYTVPSQNGKSVYHPGAILCNLFLADELNRAGARTQSALLEAMEEGHVTVDGFCHSLERPFFIMATQNPLGAAGTQLLPDSQLDRFMLSVKIGYPSPSEEAVLISGRTGRGALSTIQPILNRKQLAFAQGQVADTYAGDTVIQYLIELIGSTRNHPDILRGISPRGSLATLSLSKAFARMHGREYIIPDDIQAAVPLTFPHRLILTPQAQIRGISPNVLTKELLETFNVPAAV